MCQIIVSENFNLSREMVASLYKYNSDGLGVIIKGETPKKDLPKSGKQAWKFYMEHIHGKAGTLHFRMRTDGDISIDRVHPYEVIPGKLWMMHNGILRHYRSTDAESDTQKYIAAVLRPMLRHSTRLWREPVFLKMIEHDMGSNNRFVLIDDKGNIEILNKHTGYTFGEDWYANTYSFDARKFFPEYFAPPPPKQVAAQAASYGSAHTQHSYGQTKMGSWMDKVWAGMKEDTHVVKGTVIKPPNLARRIMKIKPQQARLFTPSQLKDVSEVMGVEECIKHLTDDLHDQQSLTVSLRNLRAMDVQEYHGILGEINRGVRSAKNDIEYKNVMFDILLSVNETLEAYQL